VREGKFFPEKIRHRSLLFSEIAKDYLKHAQASKRTWRDSDTHLQTLLEILRDAPVAELTPGHLESTFNNLSRGRNWSPATFNRHRSTLSATFQCAIRNGKAETNPARSVAHRRRRTISGSAISRPRRKHGP
jgi:site-specific recombinase XerD